MANEDGWRLSGPGQPEAKLADWRKGRSASAASRRGRWRVGFAWAGFLAVCAGFVWLSTWVRPPQPGRLVIFGAGYETNLLVPDNVAGLGGVKQLAALGGKAPLLKLAPDGILELRSDVAWEPTLERLKEPMLVLAISAHGGNDARGPYLLPNDADLRDTPRQRIRLEAILDQLAKLPTGQRKLLILDAVFMPSQAALGMLNNDFARGLNELDARIKSIPNLIVICSTSPDELSWAAPEWGTTAFGHFLAEGLRGLADEDGDRRLNALELWKFTRDNVNRWARINRFAEQTPMLLPSGAEGEHRAQHLLVSLAERNYQAPPVEERPDSQAALQTSWEKWASLQGLTPTPAVFAPFRWQRYQTGVLRVEQLLRQGDTAGAQRMQADLDSWDKEIRAGAELPAPALRQTWSLSRSDDAPVSEALGKSFDTFWEAPKDEEAEKIWSEWVQAGSKDPALSPPRRELTRLILERLAQQPSEIAKAGQRLRLIREGNVPYPPEPHFALMYSRDGPANPPAAEFRTTFPLALQVRQLAERTALAADPRDYSYSERLDPWIGPAWLEFDRARELGQDLLLGGTAENWKQAAPLLRRAEAGYRDLQADASLVRKAFAMRDRVQSRLSFYQMWALKKATPDPDLDKTLNDAAAECHALDDRLAQYPPAAPGELAASAKRLAKTWDDVEARHAKHVQQIRASRSVDLGDVRQILRDTEAALAVPFFDRLDIVARQAKLSRMLLVEGKLLTPPQLTVSASQTARLWGKRFGDFTLARFGPMWFDRWTRPGAESFAQVSHRLEIFGAETTWWGSAAIAGEQIGNRVAQSAEEMRRLTTIDPKASLTEARSALQEGDRIIRLTDAQTPFTPAKLGPATMYRYWLTADLLARQTLRTWQDHWFDDNPAAEPYFRTVCRSYQIDTQKLATALGSPPAWKQAVGAWNQKLQEPGELALVDVSGKTTDAGGRLVASNDRFAVLTSEMALQRDYRLQPSRPGDVTPGGMPVVWVETFQNIVPLEPRERQRIVVPVDPERSGLDDSAPFVCRFASPLIAQAEESNALSPIQRTSLVFKGLFRGQQIRQETRVEIQPTADIIVRQLPMPNKASVAVRTKRDTHTRVGSAQGGVAFILDASGSMRPLDEAFPEKSRYHQAFTAFKAVLEKLPKDTRVSVWTFGQSLGAEKTTENAEETIIQVIPPTAIDPADLKQMDNLLMRLSYPSVEPWNESPIARTLMKAKGDLANVIGVKAIVAITDGHDNRFEKDIVLKNRSKNMTQFLRDEFDKGDVLLNFVVFPPSNADETKAVRELKTIESLSPAGKVYALAETGKLIESLEGLLKQRLNYFVDQQGSNITVDGAGAGDKGLDISPAGQNYRWLGKGMAPGGHKLRVDAAGRVEKNILLHPGDLLLADLVDAPGGLTFERFLFSSEFPWKRSLENAKRDWKMTVLQNQLGPRKDLEMLVSLEKTIDRRESVLEQIRPRETWLEVRPAALNGPAPPIRWSYLPGFPAPAWALQAPTWPASAAPKVQMWWNPDEPARSAADLIVGDVLDDRDRRVFLPNEPPVTLESVAFEKHFVEVTPGQLAPKNCLVVRLRHGPGRPVIARLQGLTPAGSEQRLYTQADKTASLFWFEPDLDPKTRKPELEASRIRLISIAAFKEEARRRDYWLELSDLPAPDPADERPRSPLELK
jgi:hypothetical protein